MMVTSHSFAAILLNLSLFLGCKNVYSGRPDLRTVLAALPWLLYLRVLRH